MLFINASEHYEKGKRQNRLRDHEEAGPNDIRKIVGTYKNRIDEPRYSRRVSMEEIEKNDFNLNISRYVATSIDEEVVDLEAVNKKLTDIEENISRARNMHNEFPKELGLKPI